jgi:hypothetical protein
MALQGVELTDLVERLKGKYSDHHNQTKVGSTTPKGIF